MRDGSERAGEPRPEGGREGRDIVRRERSAPSGLPHAPRNPEDERQGLGSGRTPRWAGSRRPIQSPEAVKRTEQNTAEDHG